MGFSESDIKTNNALIANLCLEERKNSDVVIVPIISPYCQSRKDARTKLHPGFYEIYFSANLDCVIQRDVKGLYAKVRAGEIKSFTGIHDDAPYEQPYVPEIHLKTNERTINECVDRVIAYLKERGLV